MRGRFWGVKRHTVRQLTTRQLTTVAGGVVLAAIAAGCGIGDSAPANPTSTVHLFGSGILRSPGPNEKAITYNPSLAPPGAAVTVMVIPSLDLTPSSDVAPPDLAGGHVTYTTGIAGTTTATLTVTGLQPNRDYVAHAHTNACGATGEAAGPHFQNHEDPAATPQSPSTNPEYANPQNEIWLDVHTDATGAGTSTTTVPFVLTGNRVPGSIVIHGAMQTSTAPGQAGEAGARIACLTLSK
jgi:superoxide dismutase, Cu-Zn family